MKNAETITCTSWMHEDGQSSHRQFHARSSYISICDYIPMIQRLGILVNLQLDFKRSLLRILTKAAVKSASCRKQSLYSSTAGR